MTSDVPKNDPARLAARRTASGSKGRLLLVDDDASIRESLGHALRSEDYEVIPAADGQDAIDKFLKGYIDLVLLDLNVPVKGGWDVFERITALNPLLPIIIITARSEQDELAATAGASALMEKPLSLPQLLGTITKLLNEPVAQRLHRIANHQPILLAAGS